MIVHQAILIVNFRCAEHIFPTCEALFAISNVFIEIISVKLWLIPNSGRFEGFKSSGKIGTIENKELQNNIMDLYQENIPNVISSTNDYTVKKQRLFEYVSATQKRITDSATNRLSVLASDQSFNICMTLTYVKEILDRYDICINKMKTIFDEIDKEYGSE